MLGSEVSFFEELDLLDEREKEFELVFASILGFQPQYKSDFLIRVKEQSYLVVGELGVDLRDRGRRYFAFVLIIRNV